MLDGAGVEGAGQIDLTHHRVDIAPAAVDPAPDQAVDDVAGAVVGLGDDIGLLVVTIFGGDAGLNAVRQFMLEAEQDFIDIGGAEIAVCKAIKGAAGNIPAVDDLRRTDVELANRRYLGLRALERDARIGHIVALKVIIVQIGPRRRVEAEGERRRNAPAIIGDNIALGDIGVMPHRVEPDRGGRGDLIIGVERDALVIVGAVGKVREGIDAQMRHLADEVEAATGAAATAHGGIAALHDFDLLDREDFARLAADAANAIDIGAALRILTANERTVALRVAALTCTESDARNGAERIDKGGGTAFANDLRRQHDHGLGRIQQRRGIFGGVGLIDLIAVFDRGIGDGHAAQARSPALTSLILRQRG